MEVRGERPGQRAGGLGTHNTRLIAYDYADAVIREMAGWAEKGKGNEYWPSADDMKRHGVDEHLRAFAEELVKAFDKIDAELDEAERLGAPPFQRVRR